MYGSEVTQSGPSPPAGLEPTPPGQPERKRRHKLRNGAACSNCRTSKNKCQRQDEGQKCVRCVTYDFECDATNILAPTKQSSRGSGAKRKRASKEEEDSSESESPPVVAGGSRRPSTAPAFTEPSAPFSRRPLQASHSSSRADPVTRSTQSTPSHSSLVDNHALHVNEEEFTAVTGDRFGGLYDIPPALWWSPALVFDSLIAQRERILAQGDLTASSAPQPSPLEDSWYRCMEPTLMAELEQELPMLVNEVLVDRLSAWQFHRPRLSPDTPPSCRLYLYTLMLLTTIQNPTLFMPDTRAKIKSATERQLLQTMLDSISATIETALALELLARWLPLPSDGAALMDMALQVAERVGYGERATLMALDERRSGLPSVNALARSRIWYGLKTSSAINNLGLGRDIAMPPSNILAETLGVLNLQTSAGVQDCQLLIHYRYIEYAVSVFRMIRQHVEDPEVFRHTVESIADYGQATLREISEYEDNAQVNASGIQALKAEVYAYESQLIAQLNRHFAKHFRAELNNKPLLRETLGMPEAKNYLSDPFKGARWVEVTIYHGQKFLDPACTMILTLHRLGETPNSFAGPYSSWPRHTLNNVAFSFMIIIMAQISSYAFNMSGDGMGNKTEYFDMVLLQARHILCEAQVPVADVMSSLLEVWQRRKDSTARYYRQKARQRRQQLEASSSESQLPIGYHTPRSGNGSIEAFADQQFVFTGTPAMSAPLFTHVNEAPLPGGDFSGILQGQQSIDAWFESIFSGLDEVGVMSSGLQG